MASVYHRHLGTASGREVLFTAAASCRMIGERGGSAPAHQAGGIEPVEATEARILVRQMTGQGAQITR
jgi:hypothetical protein